MLPLLVIPEARRETGHRGLAAARWADECRDLALLCGEGHVLQYRLTGVIGKAHMVKHYIAALIAQFLAAGLYRVFQNLVHARDIRAHAR